MSNLRLFINRGLWIYFYTMQVRLLVAVDSSTIFFKPRRQTKRTFTHSKFESIFKPKTTMNKERNIRSKTLKHSINGFHSERTKKQGLGKSNRFYRKDGFNLQDMKSKLLKTRNDSQFLKTIFQSQCTNAGLFKSSKTLLKSTMTDKRCQFYLTMATDYK